MAVAPLYLADKSALARLGHDAVAAHFGPLLVDGLIATCPIIDLEVLYSARSLADYEEILDERRAMPSYPITIAVAELNDVAVLHYDADFDRVAAVTHQPAEWVVPRGSL